MRPEIIEREKGNIAAGKVSWDQRWDGEVCLFSKRYQTMNCDVTNSKKIIVLVVDTILPLHIFV